MICDVWWSLPLMLQCLAALRNCLFDAQRFLPELLLASKLLWPALLLPLAGCNVSAAC